MTENKRSFRSVFWPSLLAGLIVSILFGVLFVLITLGVIGSLTDLKPDPFLVKQNSILHITLDGEIAELSDRKFDKSALSFEKK